MAVFDYNYIGSLVENAQNGDSNSFAELYVATYQQQYRFSLKYLKDEYLAQDAIQETYILALKHIRDIKDPKLFISWLNQINFRICFKMQRKQHRLNTELSEYENNHEVYKNSSEEDPEQQIVKIDHDEFIIRQVMSLPFSESQAILLRYYNNMKIDEIASVLGCSRSTVKRYIKNGLVRLKSLVEQ